MQALAQLVPDHYGGHASWLNQIDIYFPIEQRKALTPSDFPCLESVAKRFTAFERYFETIRVRISEMDYLALALRDGGTQGSVVVTTKKRC